jgi:hypothetical protein
MDKGQNRRQEWSKTESSPEKKEGKMNGKEEKGDKKWVLLKLPFSVTCVLATLMALAFLLVTAAATRTLLRVSWSTTRLLDPNQFQHLFKPVTCYPHILVQMNRTITSEKEKWTTPSTSSNLFQTKEPKKMLYTLPGRSHVVPHRGTYPAQTGLTSVIGRLQVFSR